MVVTVDFKRGHGWLRLPRRPSLLGGGLLERVRSTTLALLGATAAVGLAIVALALNQEWPLVEGSSIPEIPTLRQGIGKAEALTTQAPAPALDSAERRSEKDALVADTEGQTAGTSPAASPTESVELVVAPSAPVEPQLDGAGGSPAPAVQPQTEKPQSPVAQPTTPAAPAPPAPAPTTPPADTGGAPPPVITSTDEPDESSPPPWSNGKGHAYGREKHSSDYGSSYEDEDEDDGSDDVDDDDDHCDD